MVAPRQDPAATLQQQRAGRGDPPLPESPVWLPGLSTASGLAAATSGRQQQQGSSAGARGAHTLPKSRTLTNNTLGARDAASLFSISTLPSLETLELPGMRSHKRRAAPVPPSVVPKLPNLDKSRPSSTLALKHAVKAARTADAAALHRTSSDLDSAGSPSAHGREGDDEVEADTPRSSGSMEADEEGGAIGPHVPTTDYDPDAVPGVNTADNVVEFYGKYGQDSPVKFFYCNRSTASVRFRPYDLVVVPRQKCDGEYFTMSATGVMRIRRAVQAEFTSLAEWVREKTLFDLISAIGFFRNYLTGRCFRRWHKGVRQKSFDKVKRQIEETLFLAKPTFSGALREIWTAVAELRTASFASANANHMYSLSEYADLQVATREQKARPAIESVIERIQKVLEKLCKDVQHQARMYQESVRDQAELDDTTGVELIQGRAAARARPMILIKKEKMDRAANFARVMRELTMLGSFIRLADYHFVEGVILRAITTAEELLNLLMAPKLSDKQSKGVFLTTISFMPNTITFAPDQGQVLEEINNTIEGVINIAQQAPRLIFMRSFAPYFEGKPSGLNPPAIIRSTPYFQDLRGRINDTLVEDYASARKYVEVFEDYRKVYDFGRTWSFDSYSSKPKSLREIRRDMHRQREWRNELERMKISNVVGCLYVDSKSLRNDLLPVTLTTLDRVKLLLLNMSRETCLQVLEDLQARIALLAARPPQLDEFMSYQAMHQEQVDNKKAVLAAAAQVDDMYDMLAAYEQKVPTNDQVKHDDLREAASQFMNELSGGKEFIADNKGTQMETLSSNIANVKEELSNILTSLGQGDYVNPEAEAELVACDLAAVLEHVHDLSASCTTLAEYQRLLDLDPDDFSSLVLVEKEATQKHQLWQSLDDFMQKSHKWTEDPILDEDNTVELSIELIRTEVDEYTQRAYRMGKANKDDLVVMRLKDCIDDFKQILPVVEELANPALKRRHWDSIFELVDADIPTNDEGTGYSPFSVRQLLQFNILDKLEDVQSISGTASKEYSLEKLLDKMRKDWEGLAFKVIEYKDTGTSIIGGTDEVQALLDDQIVKTQSMRASPFIGPLEAPSREWEALLLNLQDMVDNWLQCQATWQYLEPIFSSPDILKQMPEEGEKFQIVDQMWREIMEATAADANCLHVAADRAKLGLLQANNQLLEGIQKGLAAYLELKRVAFPRFFFLSNDEMLEILSETKDPTRVQPHLKKCFEGIDRLRFDSNVDILGMVSAEGESIPLKTKIKPAEANGSVERWLVQVENGMVESICNSCGQGMESYPRTLRNEWVLQWPGQIVLVVAAIFWTQNLTTAIASGKAGALSIAADECTAELGRTVELVRGDLSRISRSTLGALVVMDVHARDVAVQLADEAIEGNLGHFSWLSQLRMYWEAKQGGDPTVMVRMMNAQVEYGYEYLGNGSRLVVTPLTDRCYRTLMGAIHLNLGGAPEGPAGTGKTETTKDLAKALARQCVVFNCSDTLDYLTMAKFFKGLASSGAWACFDEFNRIDLEVLSVVAQQVLEIQLAVKSRVKTFFFEGSELPLRPTCNVFITMNPGYAGRSELPDNLKALFRTVAMMVPDYAMIAEIMLYSMGYLKARECACKIVATYKLCSEQLSSQDHYDYGMRAVMAVLRAAGNLKRTYPNEDEFVLMLRSIIDVNLCKFLSHDVPLFAGITSDLFPGVELPTPDYVALKGAMLHQCELMNLQPTEYFIMKVTQLYEMIVVRHGLMTVGQPFSGKSAALAVLSGALTDLHMRGVEGALFNRVQVRIINPKAVTMGQLYGENDKTTQEWRDGVLAVAFRQLASDPSSHCKWLVLDGPVDAIWIENMNTVLDDNKKLCLPNSEIIQMSSSMSMIFEVGDLAAASPATVSRCGMVYLEPAQLGWRPLLASWLNHLPRALGARSRLHIESLFTWLMPACLRCVRKELKEVSPTGDSALALSTMRLITSLLDDFQPLPADIQPPAALMDDTIKVMICEGLFIFALVWSVGCTADGEGRKKFDRHLRALVQGGVPEGYEEVVPTKHPMLSIEFMPCENGTTVYDYTLAGRPTILPTGGQSRWQLWSDTILELEAPVGASFSDIIVPTKDSARYTYLLDLSLQHGQPLLMVGPTGTGKSVYIRRHLVGGLPKDKWMPVCMSFSARTSANMTQDQVDGRLDKRRKGVYGPPVGRKCVVFVDDLNMPAKEVYGAQPPIELLRQFMDHQGWYGRDNFFRSMLDVQFVAAMGTPGGGRSSVSNRYLRHFNTLALAQVSDDTLVHIFKTILDWHLASQPFPQPVRSVAGGLIDATLEVYTQAMAKLLPTPQKSHYVFNLRDFARVTQGVMALPSSVLPEDSGHDAAMVYKRLWVHETFRVFYDRLVEDRDREWLIAQLKKSVAAHLGEDFDELMAATRGAGPLVGGAVPSISHEHMRRCFFGDYMETSVEPSERRYAEVCDVSALLVSMEEYLVDHNAQSKRPMDLAMFLFAVEHVSRICRLLKQPGGNMLLVGVGGSGRQSLTRLAGFICGTEVFQVEISKSYGKVEWREDLKRIVRRAGGEARPSVFLFSDGQIKDESFVEDINNLLNAGEVPNMFASDEKAQIMEMVRPLASKQGLETPLELWGFFVDQVRKWLHVVLCMSPIGDAFRERLRQNPSIVNCCTIDWFQRWPSDALEAVAMKFLMEMSLDDATRAPLVRLCQAFHARVQQAMQEFKDELGRFTYVTPTSYLELISTFRSLLEARRTQNSRMKGRYTIGLSKLQSSAEQVAGMQAELQALQPQLIATVAEVADLMAQVAREKAEVVEPKAAIVKHEEALAQQKADAAKAIKDECEADLAVAMPILNDALAALDTIKESDITYIKKLANPPAAIKLVLEAVCVILDVKPAKIKDDSGKTVPDYWKPSVALLNERDFLGKLKGYDKDTIPPRVIAAVRASYLSNELFTPENARKASPAAEGMCKWVHAMSSYDKVAKVVAPKRAKLAEAEGQYEHVMVGLRAKQAELQVLLEKLAAMEADLASNQRKKVRLEAEVQLCSVKLERAEKLIGGLGGEKARWTATAEGLSRAYVNLTGDMLISAGIIAYAGAFTALYRQRVTEAFVEMCRDADLAHTSRFSLTQILGEPVKVRDWLIAGLPNDSFSIENAIIVANARRWPLMIDPQGQANKWIKNLQRGANLQVIKLSDGGEYLRTLENAIQFGLPVLLENVGEELDPSLEPLLLKQVFKSGGVNSMRLGDNTIEYSDDFRFYVTTKLRNPHYLPEVAVKVTLLNFMITPAGLSDQMLGVAVATERPDLEEQKARLVFQSADNNRKLKEIEDRILEVLSSSEGNILEDETAIAIITEAKRLGNEVAEKQMAADATEREIDATREGYKACGEYTSILFFCIGDLANIDPMYQYSLPWFINLFVASVQAAAQAPALDARLENIYDHFTYSLYCNVCRSLFEKDKLLFAFLLCARIMESKGSIDAQEWMFLLTGGLGSAGDRPNPASSWLVDRGWRELCRLSDLPAFAGLADIVEEEPDRWLPMYDSLTPHNVMLPGLFNSLDLFRRLLITRCIRPDKVVPAVADFVQTSLGAKYVEPPPFNLHACYADSTPVTPLIFILSPGSDPTAALLQFAGERNMASRLTAISLGQGQGPKAAALIAEGVSSGSWVVLQNCHLAPSWMPALDKICEELSMETTHPDFRMWMTSYPSPRFPVNILQNSVKMTNEPPKGVKANMKRSYMLDPIASDDFYESCSKPGPFKKLLFGLVFFHALIQERRKFGALGWNIPYGFDDGDQRISVRQLHMFLDENTTVPYKALCYVTGECNYGGRVTDDKDRLLLNTMLECCYCPDMAENPDYKLSSSGLYYAPADGDRASIITYIDSLPLLPLPEAFGLHANADIAKDQNDTAAMFASLLGMVGAGTGGGSSTSREEFVARLVRECLTRLPMPFDLEAVQRKFPVQYDDSTHTVLVQEMSRFNKLVNVVGDSLRSMDMALQGLTVMSMELEDAFNAMSVNQVPQLWQRVSYPSLKPLASYLDDLYKRLQMLQSWYEHGPPATFWLSGFFFVQSFLTAGLQNYARAHKVPIDMVGFDFEMLGINPEAYTEAPAEGFYVHGMFLEGCGWDTSAKQLCESQPKVLFVPAPCMWLRPRPVDQFEVYKHYNCPLYRTAERKGVLATTGHSTNFVMLIKLPTTEDSQHWIRRGVAMISQLSD